MSDPKYPGQIWWAIHPWAEKISYHFRDGRPATTPAMYRGEKPCKVSMEFKRHPAIVLSPGDEGQKGYLVCYLSSHCMHDDAIKRRSLGVIDLHTIGNPAADAASESFLFCTAPCYCPDEFFDTKPLRDSINPNMFQLIRSYLLRACKLAGEQRWEVFSLADVIPAVSPEDHELLREAVRELITTICNAAAAVTSSPPNRSTHADADTPDMVFDGAVAQ